jgi:chloramphenicol-sensitive protein RarD
MDRQTPERKALAAAVGCFVIWGLFPLVFQAIGRTGATPWETLAWRTLTAAPAAAALVLASNQGRAFVELLGRPRQWTALAAAGLVMSLNWGVYIWAVDNQHTLAASLGYYLNPLMNMAAAALLFGERVGRLGQAAIALAAVGVAVQAMAVGEAPWIALTLAASFCGYSIVRKAASVEPQTGLLVECLVMAVVGLVYLTLLAPPTGVFGRRADATAMLLLVGPLSVIPLVAFGYAAKRLPLTVISFIQFITPTLLFALGAMQGEPLDPLRIASFGFIWAGAALFAWGGWRGRS